MSAVVSLKKFVSELDGMHEESATYLNCKTGEFYPLMPDDFPDLDEDEEIPEKLPAWQKEVILKSREIAESNDWLALPSKHDIHDYDIMSRFCRTYPNLDLSADLCDVIIGTGAFRRFNAFIRERRIETEWYTFREKKLTEIAIEWLDEHKLKYK